MVAPVVDKLSPAQADQLATFSATDCVDIHCHCLPGLDDGPADLPAALDLCGALVADGVTAVVASPHQLGRYANTADDVRAAASMLRMALAAANVPLQVHVGAEVRLDERLARRFDAGELMTIDDRGAYFLLELPDDVLIPSTAVLGSLGSERPTPVLTHPERHPQFARDPQRLASWVRAGVPVQVTAGSLTGAFGRSACVASWAMLEAGRVALVATDAHDVARRPPLFTAALEAVVARMGYAIARRLFIENPHRLLLGEPLAAVVKPAVLMSGRQ